MLHITQAAGGVDRYSRSLLKYFDSEKFENILLYSYDFNKDDYDEISDDFIQINMQSEISIKYDLASIEQVRKVIKSVKPDVVYMHSSKAGAIGRIADLEISNIKIYNPHGWVFNMDCCKNKQIMYHIIEKVLCLFTPQFVCFSEAEKESTVQNKIANAKKFNVILNGIDIENCNEQIENGISREKNRNTRGCLCNRSGWQNFKAKITWYIYQSRHKNQRIYIKCVLCACRRWRYERRDFAVR